MDELAAAAAAVAITADANAADGWAQRGPCGAVLKVLRKRGKAAAPQIAALLHAPATLNLEPPQRKAAPAPPPIAH